MCQSCVEIDKRVERIRELLRSTANPAEIERINRLIASFIRIECGCIKPGTVGNRGIYYITPSDDAVIAAARNHSTRVANLLIRVDQHACPFLTKCVCNLVKHGGSHHGPP